MFPRRLGDDLELRLHTLSDAEALFSVLEANRPFLAVFLRMMDRMKTLDDTRAVIADFIAIEQAHNGFRAGIYYQGALVGEVMCKPIDRLDNIGEIGYWLAESATGKGLMTRSCRPVISYLFEQAHVHRLEIRADPKNEASCAVAQRLGFTLDGILRDSFVIHSEYTDTAVYSLLDREWRNNANA